MGIVVRPSFCNSAAFSFSLASATSLKSNLIGAFRLLEQVLSRNLQLAVRSEPDRLLHHGRKVTPALVFHFVFEDHAYGFKLQGAQESLIFESEYVESDTSLTKSADRVVIAVGHKESQLLAAATDARVNGANASFQPGQGKLFPQAVLPLVQNLRTYHFHDTSDSPPNKVVIWQTTAGCAFF